MYTPEVKVENFLYILHSSGQHRVQPHQCNTTCWGRSCCKKNYRAVSASSSPTFHRGGGQKSQNVDPNFDTTRIWAALISLTWKKCLTAGGTAYLLTDWSPNS